MLAGRLDLTTLDFAVEEVPVPVPGPGEVLVAVAAAGVCLSDLHLIDGTLRVWQNDHPKLTLGHEVSGTVAVIGPDVPSSVTVGRRVILQAGQSCGACELCVRQRPCLNGRTRGVHYDGGWAQYALARHDTLVPIPDHLPFDQAAIIPDAVSTPYAAIMSTAQVRPAQSVGVWGIGGLGAHAVQLLRFTGAAPIIAIDPLPEARARASTFGADLTLDPTAADFTDRVLTATTGRGLDHAFDFAGTPTIHDQATKVLGLSGTLVLVGLSNGPLTLTDGIGFSVRNQRLLGHFGSTPEDVEALVALTTYHRLDFTNSISAHIPLTNATDAVHQLATRTNNPIRLVLIP
ncbi:D-arabinose 1-dehydrogenase-like Zn-dependent alcohol dehydrogenase [Umezawaea tangerina]|uniref:D-arabinose 1-dehydrogenase-like Zn-dependent alcohol dehydrogenase n=2 Tax=Umezawaea tangerina TaxID=84725 RepID=A0A2T0SX13_9PSEU|nr:D-arabinose 1-dehydrogenase-like Zn-dependent alcohol dehydrogenase [Umezawaea tangerina]